MVSARRSAMMLVRSPSSRRESSRIPERTAAISTHRQNQGLGQEIQTGKQTRTQPTKNRLMIAATRIPLQRRTRHHDFTFGTKTAASRINRATVTLNVPRISLPRSGKMVFAL